VTGVQHDGPVGGAESVIDVEVAQLGELAGQVRLVLLLARKETGVLRYRDAAPRQTLGSRDGLLRGGIGKKRDRSSELFLQLSHDRLERILGVGAILGPAQMRE
jgi:hypothetical protein